MGQPLLLASSSPTRLALLQAAGLEVHTAPAHIDEAAVRAALTAEGAPPRDVADTLAELKATRLATRNPGAVVIGADQVLAFRGEIWGKPDSTADLRTRLLRLRGQTHQLLTATVVCHEGRPVWRHVAEARLQMRSFSDAWLDGYLARNAAGLLGTTGGYLVEGEGIRLFSRIEGDHFGILGLPLVPLLGYLADRGFIPA